MQMLSNPLGGLSGFGGPLGGILGNPMGKPLAPTKPEPATEESKVPEQMNTS